MAAFTSKATGNWSSGGQTTWNEVGVPGDGDTASISTHTVTVDVNTTIGTSPNDATTKVVDKTSATGSLIIGTGVTFTVKGNIGGVNGSILTMNAGSTLTFDNSGSGGSPVYKFINAGFQKFNFNGSSGSPCVVQAISGQTISFAGSWGAVVATFTTFRRCSSLTIASVTTGGQSFSDCTFDTCAQFNITSTLGTDNMIFDRCEFVNGTNATIDLSINTSAAYVSGTRRVSLCKLDKLFSNTGKGFDIFNNYFGGGMNCSSAATFINPPNGNFFRQDGTLNGGNGALFPGSSTSNYFVVENSIGNPHFVSATALLGVDNTISNSVFESQAPDLVDNGDCVLLNAAACSGGNKVIVTKNIVLQSGASGAVSSSGTMVTLFNASAAVLVSISFNTVNVNSHPISGLQGALDFAEANAGTAGQVPVFDSNLVWGTSAGQGYKGMRVSGNTKDIITAAGANYNWSWNTSAGDNQLGYEDKAASNTIWTAGDAVAAGVDVNAGSGNPAFVDSSRNIAKWNGSIGGTATYAAGLVTLRANPSLIPSLITYVFAGFAVTNPTAKTAGNGGVPVGAAGSANAPSSSSKLPLLGVGY